jgi:hypothetical protein
MGVVQVLCHPSAEGKSTWEIKKCASVQGSWYPLYTTVNASFIISCAPTPFINLEMRFLLWGRVVTPHVTKAVITLISPKSSVDQVVNPILSQPKSKFKSIQIKFAKQVYNLTNLKFQTSFHEWSIIQVQKGAPCSNVINSWKFQEEILSNSIEFRTLDLPWFF